MTAADLTALLPMIVLAATSVVVMLVVAFYRRHGLTCALTCIGLVASIAMLPIAAQVAPRAVTLLLVVDGFTLFYSGLILVASLAVALLAYGYFERESGQREELYLLLLIATLGAVVLVASRHFASFFLGLELLSISLFALIAYPRDRGRPLEAGIKYLILSGLSSAFILFGMALIYADLGTLAFAPMGGLLAVAGYNVYLLAGLALIVTGIGFKLSLVPFHVWAPDVYQGAPAPVTAFLATVSKGAMFGLLLRYFAETGAHRHGSLLLAFGAIAVATMLVGNLLALMQNNVKRILAYSSIAHFGYLLVAFLAGGSFAIEAVTYYLAAYIVTTLGAFGIVTQLSASAPQGEAEALDDYRGLFWRRPWLAGCFTAMLLSLAGIPLTMGFVGKFYIFAAGVNGALWLLLTVLVIGSAIGLYYYLRVIVTMFLPPAPVPAGAAPVSVATGGNVVLATLTGLLLWLGIYPVALIHVIQATAVAIS